MRAFYVDVYGCHANLCQFIHSEKTRLVIRDPSGRIIHCKVYNTWRGAKIAMGKLSDGWRDEILMQIRGK